MLWCMLLAACGAQPAAPAATALPTSAPKATAVPPTILPTATTVPPTSTAVPPTILPTVTPVPPTATLVPPTATLVPPTIVPTVVPKPTDAPAATAATRYAFPVRSKGKVSYGKYHHDYPATDMFCPIGSLFVAPTSGVVDSVTTKDVWDPATNKGAERGGLSVAIIGDDGVRYYGSHLSAVADGIAPGVRVAVGQLLGLTGKSGDARVTDAHLHFGISHPTTPDDWATRRGELSPYPYLKAWQRGEDVTPKLK